MNRGELRKTDDVTAQSTKGTSKRVSWSPKWKGKKEQERINIKRDCE